MSLTTEEASLLQAAVVMAIKGNRPIQADDDVRSALMAKVGALQNELLDIVRP